MTVIQHKTAPARFKVLTGDAVPAGTFEAYVSVFGNEDSYGDRVMPGAFAETLSTDFKDAPLPVVWSHQIYNVSSLIGSSDDAKEDEHGLRVVGGLDLDGPDGIGETARMVHHAMKRGTLNQFSFTYDLEKYEVNRELETWDLTQVKLYEVGPCFIGANQETELLDVKSRTALEGIPPELRSLSLSLDRAARAWKAGRTLSAANETKLRDARAALDEVLSSVETQEDVSKAAAELAPVLDDLTLYRHGADALDVALRGA